MTYTWTPDRKDSVIALILVLVIPGVGHIFVGKMAKGIMILLFLLIFGPLSWLPGLFIMDLSSGISGFMWWSVLAIIIIIVVYIWQIVDAYRLAEKHNRQEPVPRRY